MSNNDLYQKAIQHMRQYQLKERYYDNLIELQKNHYTLTHLPIDKNFPLTPIETGYIDPQQIPITTLSLLAFHAALDLYPVVYQGENNGQLIRCVCPRKNADHHLNTH